VQNSEAASVIMTLLWKTRLSSSRVGIGLPMSASCEEASPVLKFSNPASLGVSFTMKISIRNIRNIAADGIMNTIYQLMLDNIHPPTVIARKYPHEIIIPNIPPNMPRSLTWNHGEFILTTLSAPKDWKYWFTA